jgi:L-fucose dehydrogenase
MDLQLQDKVVVVTGGAKGIGAAITKASVREGAIPVIVDRDQEACDKLFSELQLDRDRGRGLRVVADLQPAENCAQAVAETMRAFGRIDALINNAGVNDGVGLELGSPEKFAGSLKLNL